MKDLSNKDNSNIPEDIEEDFFDLVSKVLSFIEHVDNEKQDK